MPNFIEIEQTFVDGWTDVRMQGRTFETGFNRSTLKSPPKNEVVWSTQRSLKAVPFDKAHISSY